MVALANLLRDEARQRADVFAYGALTFPSFIRR